MPTMLLRSKGEANVLPDVAAHSLPSADTQAIRRVRDVLGITQHLEVLVEMLAHTHLRTSSKWRLVLAIEALK